MSYAILIGIVLGLVVGGRPAGLAELHFRWAPVALLGFLFQVVLFSPTVTAAVGDLGVPLYVGSTVLVLAAVIRNADQARGLYLVAVGAAANLVAIVANGGYMPALPDALRIAGRVPQGGYSNSVVSAAPNLAILVDRFAIPTGLPLANVFSLGDIAIGLGVASVIVTGMAKHRAVHQPGTLWGVRLRLRSMIEEPLSPRLRVTAFSAALGLVGVAALVLLTPILRPTHAPLSIPWPLFSVAYCLAELKVIDVHFRRETHAFSLSELPAVIGLFFVEPGTYVLGMLVGGLAALVLSRQPAAKILFNLSHFLIGAVVSLAIFQLIAPLHGSPTWLDWVAAFVATLAAAVVGATVIATVITLSGGAPQLQRLPQMMTTGSVVAVTNTSVALLAVDILWVDPVALWLVAVPVGTLFLAYRAYLSERQKHERLELLYESSRIFQRSPELDSAIVALLEHARAMFWCDRAEIIIQGIGDQDPLRTAVGPGNRTEVMAPAPDRVTILARLAIDPTPFIYVPGEDLPRGGDRLFRFAMVSPLRGEGKAIGAMLVADRTGESDEFGHDDLRLLETVANQAAVALENGQLEQSLAELSRLKEELRHQAFHDHLTGLANRVFFLQQVELKLAEAEGDAPVVLFLDLDDFKSVNDTMGHGAGDMLLQEVADRLRSCLRPEDVPARLGGDEFAILITDTDDLQQANRIAARMAEVLHAPFSLNGRDFTIGASIGIAAAGTGQQAEDLLRNADVAMYASKARGKGEVSVWNPMMHAAVVDRLELGNDLSRAIARDELGIAYQPLVELDTGKIVGFEALARWNHPTRGAVAPDEFIPLAEETGAIVALGSRVLARACRQAADWNSRSALEELTISVNLSPNQVQRPEFTDEVRRILRDTGLDPRRLVLEMTETAMFRDIAGAVGKLQELRQLGVRIAVDDFGTGYSSLRYLHLFPVDELKIAKEFITPDDTDPSKWAFAHAIVLLGQTLGLTIVAEGIELPVQRNRLRALGCDQGQGYLFSRPVPPDVVPGLVEQVNARPRSPAPSSRNTRSARGDRVALDQLV